ncbi:hypothetical protein H5410_013779 [Solanum commersonii]|uniref:Uncharacterized protein n=1 Tax=Solanum commersonii TaxID=4109 RepID=A0A9J5ZPB9_SOLCO|nr:hypothetical protein H5410_013779 [Solanum commersonii]
MDVHYDLINGVSLSRGANRCIFKLKRALYIHEFLVIRDPDLFLVEIFHGCPLELISGVIHEFLVIRSPDLFLPKNFTVIHYDLINGVRWSRGTYIHISN